MTEQDKDRSLLPEPTVLDYVRAKLMPWRGPAPDIPELDKDEDLGGDAEMAAWPQAEDEEDVLPILFTSQLPWRSLGGLVLALVAQFVLLPPLNQGAMGAVFFGLAGGLVIWAYAVGELTLAAPEADPEKGQVDDFRVSIEPLIAGILNLVIAFFAFSKNPQTNEFLYTGLNLFLWFSGLGLVFWSVWVPRPDFADWWKRIISFFQQDAVQIRITRHTVLFVLAFAVAVFFRVYRLGDVVPEMFSDHAEKLLDVYDLLQGHTKIFFERNTGREGLQFYLIAWVIRLFDTGISFISMKIGTAALGILMLPYIYLLGKELANREVGLLAMLLAGISYWPNILARVALRFILYPAFAAPVFYYLVRGLRTGKRHYFILTGIFLGIGLHGYSPFRVVPILVVIALVLYWIQKRTTIRFYKSFVWLGLVAFISLAVFLPLLRVWTQEPKLFNTRLASRLTAVEVGDQMPQGWNLVEVFFNNVWNGLLMYNWDSGDIWTNSIPGQPSLDLVAGGAFVLGVVLVLVRYIRHGQWQDGFLLFGIPVLMLPSTLALAYPLENPAPNRAGGAMVVVFVLAAIALDAVLRAVRTSLPDKSGKRLAAILALGLVLISIGQNYQLTFSKFPEQYTPTAKNTSELGAVMAQFADTVGSADQAWVVAYPHWVDTRLVGINAGFPLKDFAIWPEEIGETLSVPSPKLFLVKLDDEEGLETLEALYPEGRFSIYTAQYPQHSFIVYSIP